eukprot:TRINITY_DN12603_c0_g1_i12.p1 TRINITY_DN12603_c0_g1~~TRINITY_DN12603_c0_g1_i12.p1  ORF type:complete len:254 (+),score=53.96 TRINITY_DN12603_c0_g1_i12:34-762(+)
MPNPPPAAGISNNNNDTYDMPNPPPAAGISNNNNETYDMPNPPPEAATLVQQQSQSAQGYAVHVNHSYQMQSPIDVNVNETYDMPNPPMPVHAMTEYAEPDTLMVSADTAYAVPDARARATTVVNLQGSTITASTDDGVPSWCHNGLSRQAAETKLNEYASSHPDDTGGAFLVRSKADGQYAISMLHASNRVSHHRLQLKDTTWLVNGQPVPTSGTGLEAIVAVLRKTPGPEMKLVLTTGVA